MPCASSRTCLTFVHVIRVDFLDSSARLLADGLKESLELGQHGKAVAFNIADPSDGLAIDRAGHFDAPLPESWASNESDKLLVFVGCGENKVNAGRWHRHAPAGRVRVE